jgi:hypothetical protein
VSLPAKNKFDPQFPLVDSKGNATQQFRDYLSKLDVLVSSIAAGNHSAGIVNAANDAAAAAAGVAVGQEYRNGSGLQVRVV